MFQYVIAQLIPPLLIRPRALTVLDTIEVLVRSHKRLRRGTVITLSVYYYYM
jgi:hypothetical protein